MSHSAIMQNTLVSLPTGLGKTLIAAVVMYNYYRWFPQGKVVCEYNIVLHALHYVAISCKLASPKTKYIKYFYFLTWTFSLFTQSAPQLGHWLVNKFRHGKLTIDDGLFLVCTAPFVLRELSLLIHPTHQYKVIISWVYPKDTLRRSRVGANQNHEKPCGPINEYSSARHKHW